MTTPTAPAFRAPVSVVCVFNQDDVRRECLDRSLREGRADAPNVDLVAVDNTRHAFASAGAALNDGARRARNDYVAFVHQDVFLHDLVALEHAAGILAVNPWIGMVGAVGVGGDGRVVGRIRDRVDLSGPAVAGWQEVDSLDEVIFIVERRRILEDPLTESDELAWHAYAVEYAARLRRSGLTVAVGNIPLTHNSMTTNLERLDLAHRHVAAHYPELVPLHTTCGAVTPTARPRRTPAVAATRAITRRVLDLVRARLGAGLAADVAVCNLRFVVDRLIQDHPGPVTFLNLVPEHQWAGAPGEVTLSRAVHAVHLRCSTAKDAITFAEQLAPTESVFLTDVDVRDVRRIASGLPSAVVGYEPSTGFWIVVGWLAHTPRSHPAWAGSRSAGVRIGRRHRSRREQGIRTA